MIRSLSQGQATAPGRTGAFEPIVSTSKWPIDPDVNRTIDSNPRGPPASNVRQLFQLRSLRKLLQNTGQWRTLLRTFTCCTQGVA